MMDYWRINLPIDQQDQSHQLDQLDLDLPTVDHVMSIHY